MQTYHRSVIHTYRRSNMQTYRRSVIQTYMSVIQSVKTSHTFQSLYTFCTLKLVSQYMFIGKLVKVSHPPIQQPYHAQWSNTNTRVSGLPSHSLVKCITWSRGARTPVQSELALTLRSCSTEPQSRLSHITVELRRFHARS